MKNIVFALAALAAGAAHTAELYNNGPVVNASGYSYLSATSLTYGVGAQADDSNAVADDFNVGGNGWLVTDLSLYAYQSATSGFSFTSADWAIVSGADVNTGTVVAFGSGAVSDGGLVGYRQDTTRSIYKIDIDVDDVTLAAGHYWLAWNLTSSAETSGPFVPPVSDGRTGNAVQSVGFTTYETLTDSGNGRTLELPFTLNGEALAAAVVPEPPTYALLLAGLGMMTMAGVTRRRRLVRTTYSDTGSDARN